MNSSIVILAALVFLQVVPASAAEPRGVSEELFQVSNVDYCVPTRIPELNKCGSGSFSYVQPPASEFNGKQTGLCGEVAIANVIANLCGDLRFSPQIVSYGLEIRGRNAESGTNPWERKRVLNDFRTVCELPSNVEFRVHDGPIGLDQLKSALDYLNDWPTSGPPGRAVVTVSLRTKGKAVGHVTTVVGIAEGSEGCFVRHLTWGMELGTPCSAFLGMTVAMTVPERRDRTNSTVMCTKGPIDGRMNGKCIPL